MYACVYGDLFDKKRLRILDVGGGFCSLSRVLLRDHTYRLLELAAHDPAANLRLVERATGTSFWIEGDWYSQEIEGNFDVIVANDLFPNVDQRLALFIERALPNCSEIRLSLTYYNRPRFYLTRRLDGDEILCMLAWNGEHTQQVLTKYADRIDGYAIGPLQQSDTIFENGRQVCIVRVRGGLVDA
jgi:hypothetical protein